MTKIHVQSDVHTEIGLPLGQHCISDITICAGDIGVIARPDALKRYFNNLHEYADEIIWVLGNHEFYHGDYEKTLTQADKFAKEIGIHLLDIELGTENLEVNGIKFWGSTLWTDMNNSDWFVKKKIGQTLNDHYVISNNGQTFTPRAAIEINQRTREKINWDADVIITHHCPIVTEHRLFPLSEISYGFCNTGLENQILDSKIKYWIYGHTHDSKTIDLNGTLLVSNQQGYPKTIWGNNEKIFEDPNFNPSLILEI